MPVIWDTSTAHLNNATFNNYSLFWHEILSFLHEKNASVLWYIYKLTIIIFIITREKLQSLLSVKVLVVVADVYAFGENHKSIHTFPSSMYIYRGTYHINNMGHAMPDAHDEQIDSMPSTRPTRCENIGRFIYTYVHIVHIEKRNAALSLWICVVWIKLTVMILR